MLQSKREALSNLTNEQIAKLKNLHINFAKEQIYPRDDRFNSAIYDSSFKEIFSTLNSKNVNLYEDIYLKEGKIYFIKELESYYLGARYIAIEVNEPPFWSKKVYEELGLYGAILFLILTFIGYFLLNIILQPMKNAIALLDRFIKDTTHELNTPINAILSNIEMIELDALDENLARKIKRINIGAKTISHLYEDLTYLILSHSALSFDEDVELKPLIEERIEYFSLIVESKKITLSAELHKAIFLHIDRKKMTKLFDNILSNAIKYNKINGSIHIVLQEGCLEISDSGKGIEEEKIAHMFERYTRFDKTVGGFGIGLNIVAFIAKEYHLLITIHSKINEGTKVTISW
ncbi:MAG: HAMP domain-containing sensor histidine kinase [Sulfurospirillaceae bacterium]|nr:HAMP domain-containing sensor histidine kinase [Sulfurospirillaceae bacterium]